MPKYNSPTEPCPLHIAYTPTVAKLHRNTPTSLNKACKEFYHEHSMCMSKSGAMGECFSYIITPTGLGTILEVKCNVCGKSKTITDFDNW